MTDVEAARRYGPEPTIDASELEFRRYWNRRLADYYLAKFNEVPVLRVWQAAQFMNVEPSYLRRLKRRGDLTATRDASGHVVYRTSDIAAWVQRRDRAQHPNE